MRLTMTTALLACAAAALLAATPVEAAKKKSGYTAQRMTVSGSPRARITVRGRSYLDPGPEVQVGSRNDRDYMFTRGSSLDTYFGPGQSFRRQPLSDPWDMMGTVDRWN